MFLNPVALLALLTIPVVILFHMLKIRRQQAVVSSTLLWEDRLRELRARAFSPAESNLHLLLQVLTILALARAGQPVAVTGYERNVLILDCPDS